MSRHCQNVNLDVALYNCDVATLSYRCRDIMEIFGTGVATLMSMSGH